MATFLGTFRDDGIFGPAYLGWGYMPTAFHSIYTLHSSYVAPSTPSPARLARDTVELPVLSHIAPLPRLSEYRGQKQKLIVRKGNPNYQCLCALQRKSHLCFWELRGLSPNFHIRVSVIDLYIPMIGPHISCSRIGRSIMGIYKSFTDTWMWKLGLWPVAQFLFWEYMFPIFDIGSLQCGSQLIKWRSERNVEVGL